MNKSQQDVKDTYNLALGYRKESLKNYKMEVILCSQTDGQYCEKREDYQK